MIAYQQRKNFFITFGALLFGLILMVIFLLLYEYVKNENYLVSKCSFKPTSDTSSEIDLPIVVIDTFGQKFTADTLGTPVEIHGTTINLLSATPKILVDFSMYESCNMDEPSIKKSAYMGIRGQSSRRDPKKQYSVNFELDEDNIYDTSLLGMPSHTKWVLSASYQDVTSIRNYLAYQMGNDIMDYAPRTRFVEVYVKDTLEELSYEKHYVGLYALVEKIEKDPARVNIKKYNPKYNDISFIIARDKVKFEDEYLNTAWGSLEEDFIVDTDGRVRLRTVVQVSYPSSSKITADYKKQITSYVNDFESSLYGENFKDPTEGYRKYIDVISFVDLAMINEIFKNIDGGEVSTFFYKDIGGKLKAGPLWDFDLTLGNTSKDEVNEPTGFRIVSTVWFHRMFQDPYFCKIYKDRYKKFRKTIWTDDEILKRIEEVTFYLRNATSRDYEKWYTEDDFQSYEEEINKLREFLIERLRWMDDNIDNIRRFEESLD